MSTRKMVINFYSHRDKFGEFSNFYPCGLEINNWYWPTTEHYFQAQKFAGTPREKEISNAATPGIAAQMGRDRSFPIRPDWEDVKEDVMRVALEAKFTQYMRLRNLLLSTKDAILVEHTKNDSYWGDGGDGSGKNRLGVLLMELRDKLYFYPRKGSLALCGIGCLGLITNDLKTRVKYNDGDTAMAYTGIHLTDKVTSIGSPWSSKNPKVIGHIDDWTTKLGEQK